MKKKKVFLIFFIFLLFLGQTVFAIDNSDKCLKYGGEIPYEMKSSIPSGSHLGRLYFGDSFTEGLDFQKDSIDLNLFVNLNDKKFDLKTVIPEFKNFGNIGILEASDHSFTYKFSDSQLRLLNGLDNDSEIIMDYKAKTNEKAFVYIPERNDCSVYYSNSPRSYSDPVYFEGKGSKKITVVWEDDNDRDGLRTKQEVYYLKLDAKDPNNGPLFKVLEIPSRGTNQEEQYFYIPKTWEVYELDGRDIDNYEKIISGDGPKITYKHNPAKVDFKVNIVWKDENNKFKKRPKQVDFSLSKSTESQRARSAATLKAVSPNKIDLQETKGDYSVKGSESWSKDFQEFKYEEGKELSYSLKFSDIDKYEKSVKRDGNKYTVTYTSKIIEAEKIKPIATKNVVARKTWHGGKEEEHKEVNLELHRKIDSGKEEIVNSSKPQVKEENGNFIYTWNNMRVTNDEGKEYQYSVKEVEVPENYEVKYDGLNVTNTYKIPTKDVEVKVKWIGGDPQDTKIILYRKNTNSDLEKVGEFNSNKDNLSKIFEKLQVTDDKGQDYTYYAYEPEVPEGFTVSYSDDELTVTNTKNPEVKPDPKPNPKPEPQVLEKIEEPTFKRHEYTPTYPVVARVPEKDSLKYIFTIDEYYYKEVRNGLTRDFKMDVAPLIKSERTMLPLRYVGEALDAEVKWDEETRTATFIKNGRRAEIQIDNDEIVLSNGEILKMDSKPLNINSRILVPVSNVANVFGLTNGNTEDNIKQDIEWDKDTRTVTIYVR